MTTPRLCATDASGLVLDDPDQDQVHDLFADLNARWPFAIVHQLDRDPAGQHFFQIHLDYVGGQDGAAGPERGVDYDVEFRDGGPARHFRARISLRGFAGLDRVMQVYEAWHDGDPSLPRMLPWEPVTFER